VANFKVVYPAQLALTRYDYFQRTRESYSLNILTSKNIRYLRPNTLYFIKDLLGYYAGTICLFEASFEALAVIASRLLQKVVLGETIMNVTVFNQKTIQQYSLGHKEPGIDVITINLNGIWFYGLILPSML
jgi:hypothetical protein